MWSMVAQRLTQITPLAATPDQLWQRVEANWSAVSQEHIQSLFESMPRCIPKGLLNVTELASSLAVTIIQDIVGAKARRVFSWLEGGRTQAEVAQAIGVSQSVISRIWNRFLETGSAGRNQDKIVDGQQRPKKIVI
ncbi:hypothetical protein TNCV_813071 [Trichonephila clavipes]|nr:hypothetical protein TNCV_813071 [Trichonephila clavipes]